MKIFMDLWMCEWCHVFQAGRRKRSVRTGWCVRRLLREKIIQLIRETRLSFQCHAKLIHLPLSCACRVPAFHFFFDFLEIEKLHTWWSLVSFLNALAWSGIGFFCCFESRGKRLLGEVAGVFHGIYRRTVTKLCGLLDVVFWKADIFFTGVAVCLHSADWARLLCFYSTVEENFLCGELVILSAFSCYFDSTSCESETEGGKGSTYLFKSQLCI